MRLLRRREGHSLVRHRASLLRAATKIRNGVHALLDKYNLETEYLGLFVKNGFQ
jgi:hypothetical protein